MTREQTLGNEQTRMIVGTGRAPHRICSHQIAMPIALSSFHPAELNVIVLVSSPPSSPGDAPRDRGGTSDSSDELGPERLSELRRRVLAGHYDLPEVIASLARRLLTLLR